jgi:hypothetical protein
MRALGLDPGALRGAEARERRIRGLAAGLSPSQAYGHARRARGELPIAELRRRAGVPVRGRGGLPPARRLRAMRDLQRRAPRGVTARDVALPGGRIVTTADMGYLAAEIRRAGREGARVSFRITADAGQGIRTRLAVGRGEQLPRMQGRVEAAGTAGNPQGGRRVPGTEHVGGLPDSGAVVVVGKVQMAVSSDPSVMGDAGGFDPDLVLDWLDSYDDPWQAWGDLWDYEYE